MSTINYSIIIPHRNLTEYLPKCLETIPERDDVEIIIVDDCSDPNKVDFDNFPGKDRKGCKIVRLQECKGSANARNVGIENATGKWLVFIDADDHFTDELGTLMEKYIDSEHDLIQFDFDAIKTKNGVTTPWERKNYYGRILFHEKLTDREKCSETVEAWGKFIRRDLVMENNIRCANTKLATGMIFCSTCALKSKSPHVSLSEKLCVYVHRENSAISQYSASSELDRLDARCMQYQLLKSTCLSRSMITTQVEYIKSLSHLGFKAEIQGLSKLAKCGLLFYSNSHINPISLYRIFGATIKYTIKSIWRK
ncbi:MAG: glycosyltransferase [Bacteroidales bacterium]|nr:glycosyltransferase [Bacteroidales bacterium]